MSLMVDVPEDLLAPQPPPVLNEDALAVAARRVPDVEITEAEWRQMTAAQRRTFIEFVRPLVTAYVAALRPRLATVDRLERERIGNGDLG